MEDANFNEPLAAEAPAKAAQFDADAIAVLGKHSACVMLNSIRIDGLPASPRLAGTDGNIWRP